ncbi:NADH-dependent dehydrogenase [Planctomycetales bacterium 10988]|nr:NADH-dependent dehydrogenase [Planctomycetales bacterium 10988]
MHSTPPSSLPESPSLPKTSSVSRRDFLKKTTSAVAAGGVAPLFLKSSVALAAPGQSKNDRPVIGIIGAGGRMKKLISAAKPLSDLVAVCDVDAKHAEAGKAQIGGNPDLYSHYEELIGRDDLDAVIIGTPDHWHSKISIDALRAGKHVYCEKPLTLTIHEGKQICKVVEETGKTFQVGTQQRSEYLDKKLKIPQFLLAVALCHEGRLGKIRRVQCAIDEAPAGGPFETAPVPQELDWEQWLGQAPMTSYIPERCHWGFRWWYEYSGGKMTDWGAHHVDIAQWAIQMTDSGPTHIEGTATFPEQIPNGYNTALKFFVTCKFPQDIEMVIRSDTDNGILIEGDRGRIFVNRGRISGKPVEDLAHNPLPEGSLEKLYKGMPLEKNHMKNFLDCMKSGQEPVSDVFSHHRSLSTCHLANIAIRLGRAVEWDPQSQQVVGDSEAQAMLRREERSPYAIDVEV